MRLLWISTAIGVAALLLAVGESRGRLQAVHAIRAGGINVEPSMRPWRYVGANPDSWWCRPGGCNRVRNGTVFVDRELRLISRLHISYLRLEFPRPLIEPGPGKFDWRRADYIVRQARRYKVKLLPLLLYTPSWDGATLSSPPNPSHWHSFVAAFAHRYRHSIDAYDLWDEPDLERYWTGNAGDYVNDVLRPGFRAIRANDPGARVVLGGPATANTRWLNDVYRFGGGKYFDVMSFHDYIADRRIFTHARQVQALLDAHHQGRKPIWLGEYGLMEPGLRDIHQQALIQEVLTTPAPIALAAWYALRDDHVMSCCPPVTIKVEPYGLLTSRYVAKGSYGTMQSLLAPPKR